jgi:hypothetical protein
MIGSDRQVHISVPEDVPPGPADVVVVIVPETVPAKGMTAGDLLRSPLFGIWKERSDLGDSIEYARELRAKAEQRPHE